MKRNLLLLLASIALITSCSTEKGVTLSKEELIQNGKVYDITDETLTAVYPINNDHEYDVHVLVTNKNESVISDVYSRSISVQTVNSEDEFFQLVNGETNSTTIYLLTRNLNYEGYTWKTNDSQVFGGLFNGNGYTISNITINGTGKKDAAIFYKLRNGTIMNVNFENIKNNPKWYMGSSDPSSLLHIITTKLDMATIYGFNAASFDHDTLHKSELNAMELMKGNIISQDSYEKYELEKDSFLGTYNLTEDVYWENINEENITIKGRIIGGCIDAIKNILGTKYDYTKEFIEKYKEDGIIWYFDIFSLTAEDFYLLLIQMKEAGWLDYLKGVIVGRVKYPNSFVEMTYQEALKKVLDVPVIFNADIGHVAPKMTIINGSIATITSSNGKGTITQELI